MAFSAGERSPAHWQPPRPNGLAVQAVTALCGSFRADGEPVRRGQGVAPMRLWPASARWRWRGCSRGRSRAERECVAVAIDGSGLLVCHDSTVNGDRNFTVLKGLTPCGVDPDDGLTCSSKRLQRTVTQNRHFNEQAEFVTRQGAHPDSCPRWRRSLSGPSCPRRGEYAGATGWVLMVGTTVSRVGSAGTVS